MTDKELTDQLSRIAKMIGWNCVMSYENGELIGLCMGDPGYLAETAGVDFAEPKQSGLALVHSRD